MNSKLVLFSVLVSVLLFGSVTANQDRYLAHNFVDVDYRHFYDYTVTADNGGICVQIVNQEDKQYRVNFKTDANCVEFVDAYRNLIIVKEVNKAGAIVSYWVLQIVWDPIKCRFAIDSFPVNSYVDDEFYNLGAGSVAPNGKSYPYVMTKILEYNEQQGWISVAIVSDIDYNIYKINVAQRLNTLMTVGWFYRNGQNILGGNTYVLYDQAGNQLLIDQRVCRPTSDTPAVYNRVAMGALTPLEIYCNNKIYNMAGSYFQYVSQNQKCNQMTSFLYHGYGDMPVEGQINIKSGRPIRYIYDNYNYFVAITDCDIYLSNVYYDEVASVFRVFTNTLKNTVANDDKRKEVFCDWQNIVAIEFVVDKFYMLTNKNKFVVYGTGLKYFTKLYEKDCVYAEDEDVTGTLLKQIDRYNAKYC